MIAQTVEERSYEKNGMKFTHRRYIDGRITCELRRADDGTLLLREHEVRSAETREDVRTRYGW